MRNNLTFSRPLCNFALTIVFAFPSSFGFVQGQDTLTFEEFIQDVRTNHPLAMVADLQLRVGDAVRLAARGQFDPKLDFSLNSKDFKDQKYYQVMSVGAKVQSTFGMEIETSYGQNRGTFLNPELNLPEEGLWGVALKMPLGQGLMIDQRRAELKRAELCTCRRAKAYKAKRVER